MRSLNLGQGVPRITSSGATRVTATGAIRTAMQFTDVYFDELGVDVNDYALSVSSPQRYTKSASGASVRLLHGGVNKRLIHTGDLRLVGLEDTEKTFVSLNVFKHDYNLLLIKKV